MSKSNFRLGNAVTVTPKGFECDDMPEVVAKEVQKRKKKTIKEDEAHIRDLEHKLEMDHAAVMRAFLRVQKVKNKLWATKNMVLQKQLDQDEEERAGYEMAEIEERARQEKLRVAERKLNAKKAKTVIPPMNRKRGSEDEAEEKKPAPRKKPLTLEQQIAACGRPFVYKPQSQQELDRLLAWTNITETEAHYKFQYGPEALERKIARGEPVPSLVTLAAQVVEQARSVAEAPLQDSPPSSPTPSASDSDSEASRQVSSAMFRIALNE
jgi:hypothetical protein